MNNNWLDRLFKIFDRNMVCHYTREENALSILRDNRINFSSFGKLGDPREFKQWNFDFIGVAQSQCLENFKEARSIFDDFIKNKCAILCFCGWSNEEIDFENNAIPSYRQDYHLAGFTRSRMWTQYAARHTGVCLVFSKGKIEKQFMSTFEINKKFAERVEYQYHLRKFITARKIKSENILRNGIPRALEMQLDEFYHEFFFLKHMDYRDEHEYRLVVTTVDPNSPVSLPVGSSLEAVVVGVDFPSEKYCSITKLAKACNKDVALYFLDWQDGQPQLIDLREKTRDWFDYS